MRKPNTALVVVTGVVVAIGIGVTVSSKWKDHLRLSAEERETAKSIARLGNMSQSDADRLTILSNASWKKKWLSDDDLTFLLDFMRRYPVTNSGVPLNASLGYFVLWSDARNRRGNLDARVLSYLEQKLAADGPKFSTDAEGAICALEYSVRDPKVRAAIEPFINDPRASVRDAAKNALRPRKSR